MDVVNGNTSEENTIDIVMENIYTQCDPTNCNSVPASDLLEFITPYVHEDHLAFEHLKSLLDPRKENICVSRDKFYEIMNKWANIVAGTNQDDNFNRTPSLLEIDEKLLPFIQSTPRASFGQKLLNREVLLNVSNVSADASYNFSGTQGNKKSSSKILKENTDLEEEIKRLEHQMHKLVSENEMVKSQLALSEEQIEHLQADLGRCRTRLISEQQMIEHLQKSQLNSDEFKDEIVAATKNVEITKKKLVQCEDEKSNLNKNYQKLEEDHLILQENIQQLNKREVDLRKEIIELKSEIEIRENSLLELSSINEKLKEQVVEKENIINEINIKHDLLEQRKKKLEKMLSWFSSSLHSTCLSDSMTISDRDISSEDEFLLESHLSELRNTSHESLQHELLKAGDYETLISRYHAEITKNSKLREEITSLKIQIDSIKSNQNVNDENLNGRLIEYENIVQNLQSQIKGLDSENELLRQQLEFQKNNADVLSESSSCSSQEKLSGERKNRNFDKQNITIERLKEKIEYLEEQISAGKCTIDDLQSKLDKQKAIENDWTELRREYEENKITSSLELEHSQNLCNKLLNDIKFQTENHVQEKSTWKLKMDELMRQFSELEEASKIALIQKEEQIKENMHTLEEMHRKLQESESRYKHIQDEYANVKQEKQHLEHLDEKLMQKYQELALKLSQTEESLQDTNIKLQEKNGQFNKPKEIFERNIDLISEQETKLTGLSDELNEQNKPYCPLIEEQKMLSKSDDYKEKEMLDINEKIRSGHISLQRMDRKCQLLRQKVKNSKDELARIKSVLIEHKLVICNSSMELSRAFTLTVNKWYYLLENDVDFNMIPQIRICETPDILESLFELGENVQIVASLLKILAEKTSFDMEEADSTLLRQFSSSHETKNIQKFTLRPARLLLHRPVSPDSPSLEIENSNGDGEQDELVKDQIIHADPKLVGEDMYETKRVFEENSPTQFPAHIELPFQDNFPQITDGFLQNLDWSKGSPERNLSQVESEALLNDITDQISMNSKDLEDRLLNQHEYCQKQHKRCFYLIKDISLRLRDHKCIGATDSIYPVFVLLEDIRFLLHEIVQSAGQLGILTCENRMVKCWSLVTDYMALIKQNSDNVEPGLNERRQTPVVDTDCLNNGDEHIEDKETIESLAVIEKDNGFRTHCRRFSKLTIAWLLFVCILSFSALMFLHVWCQMMTEHQVCPLDGFIKKIQIGHPPY